MKISVVTDNNGRIVATFHMGEAGKDAPKMMTIVPLGEQRVYELEVPKHLARMDSTQQLHNTHFVEFIAGAPQLVARVYVSEGHPRRTLKAK